MKKIKPGTVIEHPDKRGGTVKLIAVRSESCEGCVFSDSTEMCISDIIGERSICCTSFCSKSGVIFVLHSEESAENQTVDNLYKNIRFKAATIIKDMVLKLLNDNDDLTEFVMEKGCYFFKDEKGRVTEHHELCSELDKFLRKWKWPLKLSKAYIKINQDGKEKIEWRN